MSRMPPTAVRRQRGLTIVELLVALVMGLVLLGGVITVFVANKETYRVQDAVARAQETGRFALSLLTRDLQRAGLTGCDSLAPRDPPLNVVPTSAFFLDTTANSRWYNGNDNSYLRPVEAFDSQGAATATPTAWDPSFDDLNNIPNTSPPPLPSTDILLVRRPDGDPYRVASSSNNVITVIGGSDLAVNDVAIVSDCEYAAIFQITAFNPATSEVTASGNLQKKFPSLLTPADLQHYRTTAYYVAQRTDGTPALWRWNGTNNANDPAEVASGIENLQVLFGVDDNQDQAVDRYESADDLDTGDWENVISARITVVVVSDDPSVAPQPAPYFVPSERGDTGFPNLRRIPVNDRRLRQVFTSTVNLRNRTS